MPIHGARRQVESDGNLRNGHADEIAHLHHFRGLGIFECQSRQSIVDGEQFLRRHRHGDARLVQFVADQVGAVVEPLFAPGDINENLLHSSGGGLEEMPAICEVQLSVTGNLQPGLMYECRRLKGLPSFLIGHPDDCQLAQFLINQWEQLIGSLGSPASMSASNWVTSDMCVRVGARSTESQRAGKKNVAGNQS